MLIEEALPLIKSYNNIPFGQICTELELSEMIIAKGKSGQLLEKIINLNANCYNHDFDNGELKTNKSDSNGTPLETMFITQIARNIVNLLSIQPFVDSWIYEKIKKLVYVPVAKVSSNPAEWYFITQYIVEISIGSELYLQLEDDYNTICNKMINDINQTGFIHTSSGMYIQIRTKDCKPYSPIFSSTFNRYISNKNFAFYFKKNFMKDVQERFGIEY